MKRFLDSLSGHRTYLLVLMVLPMFAVRTFQLGDDLFVASLSHWAMLLTGAGALIFGAKQGTAQKMKVEAQKGGGGRLDVGGEA